MNEKQEKRQEHRWECLVPVEGKEGSSFEQIRTFDFSKGGFGFVSHYKMPLNKKINIEIDLSKDGEPVFVVGKVKWVRPIAGTDDYKVGVSFEEVLRGSKGRLDKYFSDKS
ncbi:MAG: PilZ domain-containing protein [Candidatus Omnitrophica bacterium]|nr:PilZ domain-containing protein [Candidatus Omnitrophota bacterium]MBU1997081.1 PilZ domain-containing protein [Candidatus Omnitrophota bacterium]MBU4334073.1 PilZ domain-containing protein [Candidatus Omnitrophota bacterium]